MHGSVKKGEESDGEGGNVSRVRRVSLDSTVIVADQTHSDDDMNDRDGACSYSIDDASVATELSYHSRLESL